MAGGELPSILPPVSNTSSAIDGECYWVSKGEATLLQIMDIIKKAGMPATFKVCFLTFSSFFNKEELIV